MEQWEGAPSTQLNMCESHEKELPPGQILKRMTTAVLSSLKVPYGTGDDAPVLGSGTEVLANGAVTLWKAGAMGSYTPDPLSGTSRSANGAGNPMSCADTSLSGAMELVSCPPSSACYCTKRVTVPLATGAKAAVGAMVMSRMAAPVT